MNKTLIILGGVIVFISAFVFWHGKSMDHSNLIKPETSHTANTFTMTFPLTETLVPHNDHAHTPDAPRSQWMYDAITLEKDMAVTGIRAIVENAPPEVIHHLSFGTIGYPDVICGLTTHRNFREYLTLSRSNIYDQFEFPAPYALMMKAGENLSLEVMTHVLEKPFGPGGTYPDAVVKIELTYEEVGKGRTEPIAFIRLRLDDTECEEPIAHQAFAVPQGDSSFTRTSSSSSDNYLRESSDTYTFAASGLILNRSANIWGTKGGESLDVLINDNIIETYTAILGDQPWKWTIPSKQEPIAVYSGDKMTIQSTYLQSSSTNIMDASGMFGFYFAPKKIE